MSPRSQTAQTQPRDAAHGNALPPAWDDLWGTPAPAYRDELAEIRENCRGFAESTPLEDRSATLSAQVGSHENHLAPVHRWFSFKEAFSFRLPRVVLHELGAGVTARVADVFGALSLQTHPELDGVVSVEYSPLAHFVGQVKLRWHEFDPVHLRRQAEWLASFDGRQRATLPELSAFGNPDIYPRATAQALVAARDVVLNSALTTLERDFFLLGLAAVAEDLSGAMKDGRALRITRGRRRRPTSLVGTAPSGSGISAVRGALRQQWNAMVDDLVLLKTESPEIGRADHLRGDARELSEVQDDGSPALPDTSVVSTRAGIPQGCS